MERILLAVDGTQLDMPALDFACYLSRLTHSKVTGVFLENLAAQERLVLKSVQNAKYPEWELDEDPVDYQGKKKLIENNIDLFKEACEKRSVVVNIHRDCGVPSREVLIESRFA